MQLDIIFSKNIVLYAYAYSQQESGWDFTNGSQHLDKFCFNGFIHC